ncbi:Cysteine dioxygenase [Bordetella sputigena]|uniref:cysteine dioxygenase family protein n=1 Tax=Bordetella sputigena TaxID=1416810 RepID=UPI0039F0826B
MVDRTKGMRRREAVLSLIEQVRTALDGRDVTPEALRNIQSALATLAATPGLFDPESFPPSSDPAGMALYQLHREPDDGIALYLNVLLPGKSSKPHDHTTWAAIAALQGAETNKVYRRVDDGSVPGRAKLEHVRTVVVQPGTTVGFMPDDIHSIHGEGSEVIRHLHLYGRPLDTLDGRQGYDVEAGTVTGYNKKYMAAPIVCDLASI